jgi:hypothetical protein
LRGDHGKGELTTILRSIGTLAVERKAVGEKAIRSAELERHSQREGHPRQVKSAMQPGPSM